MKINHERCEHLQKFEMKELARSFTHLNSRTQYVCVHSYVTNCDARNDFTKFLKSCLLTAQIEPLLCKFLDPPLSWNLKREGSHHPKPTGLADGAEAKKPSLLFKITTVAQFKHFKIINTRTHAHTHARTHERNHTHEPTTHTHISSFLHFTRCDAGHIQTMFLGNLLCSMLLTGFSLAKPDVVV